VTVTAPQAAMPPAMKALWTWLSWAMAKRDGGRTLRWWTWRLQLVNAAGLGEQGAVEMVGATTR